ncbi:MAG: hypothetical protein KDB27_10115 [Planctomycetales bacterium]|nr:hypothetical protein [Planctomycetales bacterium]
MVKYTLLLLALVTATASPSLCFAQDLSTFDPSKVSEDNATFVVGSSSSPSLSADDSHIIRNSLVIIGLGITFCLGMALTATTIQQNRSTTPHPTRFYAS